MCSPCNSRWLADDEVPGTFVHLLFTEGEALLGAHQAQILEYLGDLGELARLHLVEILLVAAFPVLVGLDIAVPQSPEEAVDLTGLAQGPQTHEVEIRFGNHHL